MAEVSESETINQATTEGYKYGFVTDIESETAPKGLDESTIRFISAKKEEPEWLLEWRLKAFRMWLNWARNNRPGPRSVPQDRLSRFLLLLRPQEKTAPRKPRRRRSQTAGDLHQARHSAAGTKDARRCRGRCGVRQRLGRDHLQGRAQQARRHLSAPISEAVQKHPELVKKYLGRSCRPPTILTPLSTRRSSPTDRSSTSPKACAARWNSPPISASTRRTPASSSAR